MDTSGNSDPYCVIKFGTLEYTTEIQYRTLNPVWNQTFSFEVDNIPQAAFAFPLSTVNSNGALQLSQIPLCELLYYIFIDIWDKDTLNRFIYYFYLKKKFFVVCLEISCYLLYMLNKLTCFKIHLLYIQQFRYFASLPY